MIVFIVFAMAAFAVDFFAHKKDEKNLAQTSSALVYFLDSRFRSVWRIFVFCARKRNDESIFCRICFRKIVIRG